MMQRALISLSDKRNLKFLLSKLHEHHMEIIATGSTAQAIRDFGFKCLEVSEVTGMDEMLEGRVKTLHPKIHGGILADRSKKSHQEDLQQQHIQPIDFVFCNLYPFQEILAQDHSTHQDLIENIDIGGVTLLRAAAKNHQFVSVICNPDDYEAFVDQLQNPLGISDEFRLHMAAKAFSHTASYDVMIASYMQEKSAHKDKDTLLIAATRKQTLRYGENAHQEAAYFEDHLPASYSLKSSIIHQGKELSYNNILDFEAALMALKDFHMPACIAIKHNTPCGVGEAENIFEAYEKAYHTDPISIFGGIVALNRKVDLPLAQKLNETFLELVIAPEFSLDALKELKKKKNLRVLETNMSPFSQKQEVRKIQGGYIVQQADLKPIEEENFQLMTGAPLDEALKKDLILAQKTCKYVKSNGIVIAGHGRILGIGGGEVNRIDAVKLAMMRALQNHYYEKNMPLILASDAFFPFADIVDYVKDFGVKTIIQPGGSIRDKDVIQACEQHHIQLIFTGIRHFKH